MSPAVPLLLGAVGLALAVAAVGLAARPSLHLPAHHGPDPNAGRDLTLAIGAIIVGAILIRQARRLAAPYQRLTYRLVGTALIAGPILVVNLNRILKNHKPRPRPTSSSAQAPPVAGGGGDGRSRHGADWGLVSAPTIISAILTLAACVLLAVVAYRLMRRPGRHVLAAGAPGVASREDVLRRAAAAIELGADPRARVIAAYEAMEAALESPRRAPQAPLEWLAGLADTHPAAIEPARELTEIFERARFRTVPVTEADADQARHALDRLRAAART